MSKSERLETQGKQGRKHVIFIKQEPMFQIENPLINIATVYLSEFEESSTELSRLLHDISELTPDDKLKLIINSHGGRLTEGKAIINTIRKTGTNITTELVADADSMAALMFCIGHKRIVYENSSIMFHTFSGSIVGKGYEMEDQIVHLSRHVKTFFKSIVIGLEPEEIQRLLDGKEWWFDTYKMCKRGIATHVYVHDVLIPADKYLKLLKKTRKIANGLNLKIDSLSEALIQNIDALTPLEEEQQEQFKEIQERFNNLVNENEILLDR